MQNGRVAADDLEGQISVTATAPHGSRPNSMPAPQTNPKGAIIGMRGLAGLKANSRSPLMSCRPKPQFIFFASSLSSSL